MTNKESKSADSSALHQLKTLFKPSCMGLGFLWSWIYCSFETHSLFPLDNGASIKIDASWLPSSVTICLAAFAIGIALRKHTIYRSKPLIATAVAAMSVGTFLPWLTVALDAPVVLSIVGGVMSGAGSALLYLLWGDALSHLEEEQAEVVIPLSAVVGVLFAIAYPFLEGPIGLVVVVCMPIFSGIPLFADKITGGNEAAEDEALTTAADKGAVVNVARIGIAAGIVYAIFGCMSVLFGLTHSYLDFTRIDIASVLGNSFGIILALCFTYFSSRISMPALVRWLMPPIMASLVLTSVNTPMAEFIGSTISTIADTTLQCILFITVIYLVKRRKIPSVLAMGIVIGLSQGGVLAGNVAGVCLESHLAQPSELSYQIIMGAALLLTCVLWILPQDRPYYKQSDGAEELEPRAQDNAETLAPSASLPPEKKDFAHACDEIAAEFGLTRRESEVFTYLARGRTQSYIRDQLVLSKNTISTHVRHIYAKLDVHSREELIDMVHARIQE